MRLPSMALVLLTGVAHAATGETLVLPVEAPGVPAQKAARVDRAMSDAAGVRQILEADRRKSPRYGCRDDASCWAEVGKQLGARRIVGSTLTAADANQLNLSILYVDVASGNILSRGERKLSPAQLDRGPRKLLADVLWQAPSEAPTTPLAAPVVIEAPPAPPVQHARSGRALLRPLKWSAAGGAVAAIVAGAALLAIDGGSTCSRAPGQRQCPVVYDTLGGGAALVAVGGVLAATSVVLFVLDRRWGERKSWAGAIVPAPGGAFASVGGRF